MMVWQQLLQVNWFVVFFSNAMRIRTKDILIHQWVIINISERRLEMTLFSACYCQCTLPFLSLWLLVLTCSETPIRYLACLSISTDLIQTFFILKTPGGTWPLGYKTCDSRSIRPKEATFGASSWKDGHMYTCGYFLSALIWVQPRGY